jgi:hypothetical protein
MGVSASFHSALLLALILLYTLQLPLSIAAAYVVICALILHPTASFSTNYRSFTLLTFAFIPIIPALLTFNHGVTPIVHAALTPILFLYARNLVDRPLEHGFMVLRSTYWWFTSIIGIGIGLKWGEPEPLGALVPWAGTNGIPTYLIVVQSVYSLLFYFREGRLPLLSCLATVVISVIGLGRGSIIISITFFLFSCVANVVQEARGFRSRVFLKLSLGLGLTVAFGYFFWSQVAEALTSWYAGSRLSLGLYDEYRAEMIQTYIRQLSGFNLIFGAGYEGTAIMFYDRNPHNSFVRAHAFFGLYSLFLILLPVAAIIFSKRVFRQKLVAVVLLSLVLVRATTEPILFPTPLDVFYIIFVLSYFRFSCRQKIRWNGI